MPQPHDLSTPLAYALAYAEMGWHVLPLEPGTKIPLGRLVPRGMLDATTDAETIRGWWRRHPQANIGIALAQSGLVAIDVDPRNGGVETFEQLQAAHGNLRSSVTAFTGGGGEHHVFVIPPGAQLNLPGTLGPGVDLKANGYIVAEPSIHPSGRRYDWEASSSPLDGAVPSPLPDWLRSLRVELQQPQARPGDVPVDAAQARDVREALYLLDADDYAEWLHAGMALHSTRWGHPAYALWCAWSQQSQKFDSTVCRRKWESFSTDAERGDIGITLAWVFGTAQKRGWANPRAGVVGQAAASPAGSIPLLSLAELQAASAAIVWSVKHVIPADSIGVLFGGSGTFKSFIALDYALHVAHGMPWMGRKTRKGPVLFIAAEGGAGLWKRVQAWHQRRGLDWNSIEFYVVPVALSLAKQAGAVVSAAAALGVEPSVVVVDTMSQTFDGEENSASEVSVYLRELGIQFRALWRCTVLVIHHSGHQATERPRGSSAIRANVDFMLGVFRDEKEMLATVECHKQKDGELFEDRPFSMTRVVLGHDEDGEEISSLCAAYVDGVQALVEHKQAEAKAGRGGRDQLLFDVLETGMTERDARMAFYKVLPPDMDAHNRKVAYYRARDALIQQGRVDIGQMTGAKGVVADRVFMVTR